MNWNPLYSLDEDAGPLDEAIKEVEWEDDMRQSEQRMNEEN